MQIRPIIWLTVESTFCYHLYNVACDLQGSMYICTTSFYDGKNGMAFCQKLHTPLHIRTDDQFWSRTGRARKEGRRFFGVFSGKHWGIPGKKLEGRQKIFWSEIPLVLLYGRGGGFTKFSVNFFLLYFATIFSLFWRFLIFKINITVETHTSLQKNVQKTVTI